MRNLNVPNLLTLLRLAMAPAAVWAIVDGRPRLALVLFAVAAVTDALDGYLARALGVSTRFGAYMDPIADKVLLTASYIGLGMAGFAPWWLVGLILGRDALILAMVGAALLFTRYRDFPPSRAGKISTIVQAGAAAGLLAGAAFPAFRPAPEPLVWAAAAATAISGAGYLARSARMARSLGSRERGAAARR